MKATSGRLRLDQSYKLLGVTYGGKYSEADITAVVTQCENCMKPIANVADVIGSVDGKTYSIGLDCASTLTSIEPSEIAQAKKQMAKEAKFRKWIMESMLFWIVDPENEELALLFEKEPRDWDFPNEYDQSQFTMKYDWRCRIEKYKNALDTSKKRSIIESRKVPYEWDNSRFQTYYKFVDGE